MITAEDLHNAGWEILTSDPLHPCKVTELVNESRLEYARVQAEHAMRTGSLVHRENPIEVITFLMACILQATDSTVDALRSTGDPYTYIATLLDESGDHYANWLKIADQGISWYAAWVKADYETGMVVT